MYIDPNKIKFSPIGNYLSQKKVLLFDEDVQNEIAFKKLFSELGVPLSGIWTTDEYNDALEKIKSLQPDILVSYLPLSDKRGLQILEQHLEVVPDRLQASFFLSMKGNSAANASLILDYEVDGLFPSPFTMANLQSSFLEAVKNKVNPTPYLKKVEEGKIALKNSQLVEALKYFQESQSLTSEPFLSIFYQGKVHFINKDLPNAEYLFKEGLNKRPQHYKCLNGLLKLFKYSKRYKEAYQLNSEIMRNYPVSPHKIPELTKLSIINNKIEDLLRYGELFPNYETNDPKIQDTVAAGLALCGKVLIKEETIEKKKKALKAFELSARYSKGRPQILDRIIFSLIESEEPKLVKIAESIVNKNSDKISNENLAVYEFLIDSSLWSSEKTLVMGRRLIDSGTLAFNIYRQMIRKMVVAGFPKSKIKTLANEVIGKFPDKKELVNKMIPTPLWGSPQA